MPAQAGPWDELVKAAPAAAAESSSHRSLPERPPVPAKQTGKFALRSPESDLLSTAFS